MDKIFKLNIKETQISYKTKAGVFSQQGLDNGTKLLLDHMVVRPNTLVADLGSGGGIVGLVYAKLDYQSHVHLLEDHLRSKLLSEENVELNRLKNAEVFLSDLFSAVSGRSYHYIYSNPPAQMGNDFLEEVVLESFKHLKAGGELWFVVPNNLKPLIIRLFEKYFTNYTMVASGREHIVIKAQKRSKE